MLLWLTTFVTKMSLHIIIGSMYSGKTTELLRQLSRDACIGRDILYINHNLDNRDGVFSTHNPLCKARNSKLDAIKVSTLPKLEEVSKYDTVGIDESQFFDNLDQVREYIEKGNINVIMAGLNGDAEQKKFGKILDLIPYADTTTQLHGLCNKCAENGESVPAPFTLRLGKKLTNSNIDIGGCDKYIAVCRKHYHQYKNK